MVAVAVLGLAGSGVLAQEATEAPIGVSFSGEAGMGVKYGGSVSDNTATVANEKRESRFSFISDFDVTMSASGTTDGGLTFGAAATIKAGSGSSTVGASNVYIGGESWKIAIGDLDPASHMGRSIGDVGYDGLGVDNVAEEVGGLGTNADIEVSFNLGAASLAITAGDDRSHMDKHLVTTTPALPGDGPEHILRDSKTRKQETVWAAGAQFAIGSTTLGLGMDSEKLMQAGIGADLGAFGGKLFFSQQKDKSKVETGDARATIPATEGENANVANRTITNKRTGIGVEITVSAGANTTINAVYAQGKQTDTRSLACGATLEDGACPQMDLTDGSMVENATFKSRTKDPVSKTDKGFGVGVTHNLGGGATLAAGFAKVKKRTMASVGVTMKF